MLNNANNNQIGNDTKDINVNIAVMVEEKKTWNKKR